MFQQTANKQQMSDNFTFNKIINDYYIEVELTKMEPHEVSFILVQNQRQQCFQLKFGIQSMPLQLKSLFANAKSLYQYITAFQDNRTYFDISPQGKIIITKQVAEEGSVVNKTVQLIPYPVKIRETVNEDGSMVQQRQYNNDSNINLQQNSRYGNYFQQKNAFNQYNLRSDYKSNYVPQRSNHHIRNINSICDHALMMIQSGERLQSIAHTLKLKYETVKKMMIQVNMYGTIYPPQRGRNFYNEFDYSHQQIQQNMDYYNYQSNDEQYYHINQPQQETWPQVQQPKQLGPVTPNMKMHGDGVRQIKKMLFGLVKEGKMQSLDQMRNFLLERNIDRSLSSIYRYISSIKIQHPQFQGQNYTMYRKDMENLIPLTKLLPKNGAGSKTVGDKIISEA